MKRPSFQFYPADWTGNSNLRRCTHTEKGIWLDVLCLMHDCEEYGVLRWSLKEIAQAVGCSLSALRGIADKGVLKGADKGSTVSPFVYVPRSGRKDGDPVTLIAEQMGPLWYSSRMVRDEYVRNNAGASTRFVARDDSDYRPPQKKGSGTTERAKLRAKVQEKTGGVCYHCNCQLGDVWEIDHLMPRSKGGRHTFANMVPSCVACNQDKSDTLPDDWNALKLSPSQRQGEDKGDSPSQRQGDGSTSTSSTTLNTKTLKALSGKPNAIAVLDYLNERTGRSYQAVDSNTKLIAGRLNEGATVEQCKAVIDAKVAKWGADPKMDEYLRPKTLFNATNYAQYAGELGAQKIAANSSGNDRPVDPRFRGCK
jgi:uncharacterized phage protein (TIGR02220 family)